ncbi:MAG: ROK family protein [Thermaerobacter sp.]|nr:ROK family protein [Thermaerobacter sp.]
MGYLLGVDLGGTKIEVGVVSREGVLGQRLRVPTPRGQGTAAVVDRIRAAMGEVLRRAEVAWGALDGVGVGAPGPLDRQAGVILEAPNLPELNGFPLAAALAEGGVPLYLENDANAAALGEYRFGAGRGSADLVYVTVSTGIGGGIILGGRLYRGVSGTAGEVGHTVVEVEGPPCACGSRGCLETLASGTAIARQAAAALAAGRESVLAAEGLDAAAVYRAAGAGDVLAREITERAGYYLGVGISNLINLLNPERVILGGGVVQAGRDLFDPVERAVRERALKVPAAACRILPAGLGQDAGVLGAAAVVLEQAG